MERTKGMRRGVGGGAGGGVEDGRMSAARGMHVCCRCRRLVGWGAEDERWVLESGKYDTSVTIVPVYPCMGIFAY